MIVGKYSLNGNANDSAGSNNGVSTNVTWVDGKMNGAGSFNGTSSKILIPNNTIFDFGANYSIDVLCYINALPTTGNLQTILYRLNTATTGPQFELVLFNDGGVQKVFVSHATTFNPINYTLPIGKWITLGVKYGSNTITFTLDGVIIGTVSQSNAPGTSNKQFAIGVNYQPSDNRFFNGKIDEIVIDNITLNNAQSKNKFLLYNGFI